MTLNEMVDGLYQEWRKQHPDEDNEAEVFHSGFWAAMGYMDKMTGGLISQVAEKLGE